MIDLAKGVATIMPMKKELLAHYILPCSATMVGVCLTSIGLVKIIEQRIGASHVDEYLALNSIIFLASAVFSYLVLRANINSKRAHSFERIADFLFITGLGIMVIIATLFAYETI